MLAPMIVDLRSDTVTKPSVAMRRAMADAEVGDDVYGEDPTAQRLEARTAELLGKEAALFVPSGTMANQIALLLHCRKGDAVLVGEGTHCMLYETGGAAALAGVQFSVVGSGGLFSSVDMEAGIEPCFDWLPRSRLVVIENTHNRGGGRVFAQADVAQVAERAHARGLAVHLDGARLWNASTASGLALDVLAQPADTLSVCFSKGLGAPAGSAIVGTRAHITEARRLRKMLGGGMRQVGMLCAAALIALDQRDRLTEDHALARRLAEGVAKHPSFKVDLAKVQTNIVMIETAEGKASELSLRFKQSGILINAMGASCLRAVTHRDLSAADITRALTVFGDVA